jgi:hypothetical protein
LRQYLLTLLEVYLSMNMVESFSNHGPDGSQVFMPQVPHHQADSMVLMYWEATDYLTH